MAKNCFVAEVNFDLSVGAKKVYGFAHRLVFSQNAIPYLSYLQLIPSSL